ncbi:hypothetical protein [Chitinophaga pinensis]|uniref:Uncharacterized protein n=1 Tax=Chitinophaga pinensis TaxID=79329 RepID=A0A5C6LTB9_9BACT|nr:hypothetical protein [Chitinophaga pinensis]TWV99836.1 hypothetical protein FEF09_14125 [Chitinophaga pinensis]
MNQTTHTTLRKKISIHVQILTAVMFVGLLFHIRHNFYPSRTVADVLSLYIFPEKLWEWAILVPFGLLLYLIFLIPVFIAVFLLFLWGRGYAANAAKARKVRNWLIGFALVLAYGWGEPALYCIQKVFPPKETEPFSPGIVRAAEPSLEAENVIFCYLNSRDQIVSETTQRVLYIVALLLYTIETGWIFLLLWKAEVFEKKQPFTDAGGSSLS